jgi:hypothetical protein
MKHQRSSGIEIIQKDVNSKWFQYWGSIILSFESYFEEGEVFAILNL